ncbi:DUF3558 domain-containing protein [Mycolicibacterium sp. S2-37]|uniref:DUF3558 domain-containing protein n=1 Tax=Mycolicibacterium sp. S2-37 TaxID=2810297 RepID=UPI001A93F911|nr:DUF3558 domain-containing protein [Mycolicibacterium sp. S2-37]MBO0678962.1 DUF3558 domain-containing protein [Mycolicibacterium sp. S2-37]
MRRRVTRGGVLLAVAVTATVAASGCANTVTGTAQKGAPDVPDPDRNYGYVDNRCGLLEDSTVAEVLGADEVLRPYSGAVCQYVLARGQDMVDVTFSWFKSGTLARERALAVERDAEVTDTVIQRHPAFIARNAAGPSVCSVTAAAGPGVLSWWVQLRGKENEDACADAEKLLSATLSSDM